MSTTDTDTLRSAPNGRAIDLSELASILDKITIFGGLKEDQLRHVLHHCHVRRFDRDDVIFRQGESPSDIYVTLEGRVRIVVDYEAAPMELVEFEAGDCFGETSAIGILPHSASAVPVEPVRLLMLPREGLLAIHREDPSLFGLLILNIAREACRRLHHTDQTFLHYAKGRM